MDSIRLSLGFDCDFYGDQIDLSGGLGLFWNNDMHVSLLSYSTSHIDVSIILSNSINANFTSFDGYPKNELRCFSWDLLRRLNSRF